MVLHAQFVAPCPIHPWALHEDQAWKPHGANNLNTSYDSFLESLDFASWTVRSAQKDTHSFVMRCCLNSESLPFMFKQCIFQLEKQLSVWRKTWHTVIPQISVLLTNINKHQHLASSCWVSTVYHVMLTPSLEVLGSYFVRPRMHRLKSPGEKSSGGCQGEMLFHGRNFKYHLCFIGSMGLAYLPTFCWFVW